MIEIFEKKYIEGSTKENKDYFITNKHMPVDGDYIILRENSIGFEEVERIKVKKDKITKKIETTNQYFDFIQTADYMSRYLDSNKAISDKNIHSNNYLTLFIKKENLFNGKIIEETISSYYDVFKNPYKKKYTKSQLRKSYELLEEKYGKSDLERIQKIEAWVQENLLHLNVEEDKTYLKIFFLYDIEEYRKESEKYILTNIYNSADYNTTIDGAIFGVPNNNMGLNAKKKYLEQKSRKNVAPILLSQEEVLIQKKFFDYLNNMAMQGKVNLYFNEKDIYALDSQETPDMDFSGYFIRLQKGMEPEIHDFDTISCYSNEIRSLKIKNVLQINKSDLEYKTIHTLKELEKVINVTLFKKFLSTNYFTEAKKISIYDESLKRNLLLARTSLFNWFYKGIEDNAWKVLKLSCLDMIKGSIYRGDLWKDGGRACEQFNLYISLKYYFERRELMDNSIVDVEELREKVSRKITGRIESDEEYYFAVGQLANYFLTKSKAKVKSHFLSKPILTAKTDEKIKDELKKLYHKYSYDIKMYPKFNNLYAMVCLYVVSKKQVNEDALLAGYLHSSLIYETKEESGMDDTSMNIEKE